MIKGKLSNGFEFQIEEEVLDDYEFLEMLVAVDQGEVGKLTLIINALLGQEQVENLKDAVRNEKGKVSARMMMDYTNEIFSSIKEIKNS